MNGGLRRCLPLFANDPQRRVTGSVAKEDSNLPAVAAITGKTSERERAAVGRKDKVQLQGGNKIQVKRHVLILQRRWLTYAMADVQR